MCAHFRVRCFDLWMDPLEHCACISTYVYPMHTSSSLDLLGSHFIRAGLSRVFFSLSLFCCVRANFIVSFHLDVFFSLFRRIDAKAIYVAVWMCIWTRHFSVESSKRLCVYLECLLNAPLNKSIIFDCLGLHFYSIGFGGGFVSSFRRTAALNAFKSTPKGFGEPLQKRNITQGVV